MELFLRWSAIRKERWTNMEYESETRPLSELLRNYEWELPKKRTSKRAELTKPIYALYCSEKQRTLRKRENWKRYVAWLKENCIPDSKEMRMTFKKSKRFIKELPIKTFCYFLSVIPTDDLFFLESIGKDMDSRNQNFGGYLMANLMGKVDMKR